MLPKFILVASLTLSLSSAYAQSLATRIYAAHQEPRSLDHAVLLDGEISVESALKAIRASAAELSLGDADLSELELKNQHQHARGTSYRFIQKSKGVIVEGAELVVLITPKGEIEAINSSITAKPAVDPVPTLDMARAIDLVSRRFKIDLSKLGSVAMDGLRIVGARSGKPMLVWQFAIRDLGGVTRPMKLQIIASGSRAGEIFKSLGLGHDLASRISIFDATVTIMPNPEFKGILVMENGSEKRIFGKSLASDEARHAHANFERVQNFYQNEFNRSSYDNAGAPLEIAVNASRLPIDLTGLRENAAWVSEFKMFMFGAGGMQLAGFTAALDVIGHEYTHAVVSYSSDLAYEGQSGALNEHLADVFGSLIQSANDPASDPYLLGETILRGDLAAKHRALRDMAEPAKSLKEQPGAVSEIPEKYGAECKPGSDNDNCGVHILSGIPNRAYALAGKAIGLEPLRQLYYRTMTARLRSTSDFRDFRNQLVDECAALLTAEQCQAVREACDTVGM